MTENNTNVRDLLARAAGIPDHLRDTFITATDPEAIATQVEQFAATFGALDQEPSNPTFASNPAQGQAAGDGEDAGYSRFRDQHGRPQW